MSVEGRTRWLAPVVVGAAVVSAALVAAVWTLHGEKLREEWHLRRLSSSDTETRLDAARVLGELRSERAVVTLLEALADSESRGDQEAGAALSEMGPFAADQVGTFVGDSGRPLFARLAALRVLETLGPRAAAASVAVESIEDPYLVPAAMSVLAAMGDAGMAALIRRLAASDINTRYYAANALAGRFPEGRLELRSLAASLERDSGAERTRRARELVARLVAAGSRDGTELPPGDEP